MRKSIEVDLALVEEYGDLINDLELTIVREAKRHDADAFHRLRSGPGLGKVLALTILDEIHDITRFDRVQEFASYARLVKCVHQSAGKTIGTGGAKMGNVHLKWAFSEAAGPLHREDRSSRQHVIDRSPDLVGEDRQRLALPVLLPEPRRQPFPVSGMTQEEQSATPRRSGASSPAACAVDGTPALFLATHARSQDARPLPRAWRQRTRRHEEAGMRARMRF